MAICTNKEIQLLFYKSLASIYKLIIMFEKWQFGWVARYLWHWHPPWPLVYVWVLHCFFFPFKLYLFIWKHYTERGIKPRVIFHPLFHSPDGCKGQGCAWSKQSQEIHLVSSGMAEVQVLGASSFPRALQAAGSRVEHWGCQCCRREFI